MKINLRSKNRIEYGNFEIPNCELIKENLEILYNLGVFDVYKEKISVFYDSKTKHCHKFKSIPWKGGWKLYYTDDQTNAMSNNLNPVKFEFKCFVSRNLKIRRLKYYIDSQKIIANDRVISAFRRDILVTVAAYKSGTFVLNPTIAEINEHNKIHAKLHIDTLRQKIKILKIETSDQFDQVKNTKNQNITKTLESMVLTLQKKLDRDVML
jgi:hypothetical protein